MTRKTQPSLFAQDSPAVGPPLPGDLPQSWLDALQPQTQQHYWGTLQQFVEDERQQHTVFPPKEDVYNAFRFTPLDRVKVLLLGQDPYHGEHQAHGLCFSVRPGIPLPPSLRNIYRELQSDVGAKPVKHGCLTTWAKRGVLLLNACLTVREGKPNSHAGKGWEHFTDAAITAVNALPRRVVFILWGSYARKKVKLIDTSVHTVIEGVHPSPLSASAGFFGSKPFSRTNQALEQAGETGIDWQLPEVPDETGTA